MGIQKPRHDIDMQILIIQDNQECFSVYVVNEERSVFLDSYKDLFSAVLDINRRIDGEIAVNVLMFPDEDEWQVLDEVPPTQANERKAK